MTGLVPTGDGSNVILGGAAGDTIYAGVHVLADGTYTLGHGTNLVFGDGGELVWSPDGTFIALELLAKHDEKYMPPEVADALKRAGGRPEHATATLKPSS